MQLDIDLFRNFHASIGNFDSRSIPSIDKLLSSLKVILSSQEFWMYGASTWVMKQSQHNRNDNVHGCGNMSERSLEKHFINPNRCQIQKVCRTFSSRDQRSIFS